MAEETKTTAVATTPPARKLDLDKIVTASGMGGGVTFLPRTMQECLDFATIMSKSDFAIPPAFRNNPGACLAVTIQACRFEADPFGVIQKAYITKAKDGSERLAYEAQLFAAIVNTRARLAGRLNLIYSGEGMNRAVKVVGVFRDTGEERDVQTPPVSKIKKHSPVWVDDPDQQLAYYGIRSWARRWVPELMLGIYTPEDFEDEAIVDAPRPRRDEIVVQPDTGITRQATPEPAVEVRATAEEILGKAEDLTAPITRDEAAVIDETIQTRRDKAGEEAAQHGIAGEGLEPVEDDDQLPTEGPETNVREWEIYLSKSIEALSATGEDALSTEGDFDEFAARVKDAFNSAPISQDDRDDMRARFVSAYLTKKREKFGARRR